MKAYIAKLMDLTSESSGKIARQWAKDVRTNSKTGTYHGVPENEIIRQAVVFFSDFRQMFLNEEPYEEAEEIFGKFAEDRFGDGVPLHEAVYALILMRRHIWLYLEIQSMEIEHRQAIECLGRTILMFEYIVYIVVRKYIELMKQEHFKPSDA
jgi:hypothetical protein